jgi:Hemerythrin HHE cation binding domain
MASSRTIERSGRADWTLMTAIHDALRRDLDQLITTTAGPAAARARWIVLRDQLRRHIAAEHAARWRPAQAKLTGDPRGQALPEAMGDERQLIGPLQAVADDAFARGADPGRLRPLLARLRTKLTSHLAHEEADAPPLPGQIMSPAELGTIAGALRSGTGGGRAAHTIPWALARASPALRTQVLSQLPAPFTRSLPILGLPVGGRIRESPL